MSAKITSISCLMAVVVGLVACPSAAGAQENNPRPTTWQQQPINDEAISQAMQRAIDYLWKAAEANPNKEGNWEVYDQPTYEKEYKLPAGKAGLHSASGIYSGQSALVLLSLLKAGVSQDDKRFQKVLKMVMEVEPKQNYARALRGALFASLDRPKAYGPLVEREKEWLLNCVYGDGTFGYYQPANLDTRTKLSGGRDLSNTQYGVLGMWLISDYGYETPDRFWRMVQTGYLSQQAADGGWNYGVSTKRYQTGYQSLTLGALASLFIVWDRIYTTDCSRPADPNLVKAIKDGLDWLATNYSPSDNALKPGAWVLYTMYGVERVGVASGLKYFGNKNWWDQSARYVMFTQQGDGSWPVTHRVAHEPVSTAWALLFLSYGRAPVVFNKLAYDDMNQWNSRPRDLARLTGWISRTNERLYNWQIMPIERPVDELADAPILFMSGRGAIRLKAEQKAKLKDYVLGGGLLMGEAVDDNKAFNDSFRAMIRELFPELELQPLQPSHPILSLQFPVMEKRTGAVPPPALEGLSNGLRTMVVLSPKDLGCAWQRYDVVAKKSYFELAANLTAYVSDRNSGLVSRGTSYMDKDLRNWPGMHVTVGRLAWGSKYQWDPEPFAWRHMDLHLRNSRIMSVKIRECDFKEPVDPKLVPMVHLTGVGPVELTDVQRAQLKRYVQEGGLLLADAAGGNKGFSEGFVKLSNELFGPLAPISLPFANDVTDKGRVHMRHVDGLPKSLKPLEVLGVLRPGQGSPAPTTNAATSVIGPWAVIFLPYDLTAGMTGYPNVEPVGLAPASADKFATALLKWVAAQWPPASVAEPRPVDPDAPKIKPAPPPATQPVRPQPPVKFN